MATQIGTRIVIRLFGSFSVGHADGSPVLVPPGRQKALIALLASAPEMRRNRAWLIDKLWTDCAPARGRANLRQLLHALRQSFGPDFDDIFDTERDSIALRRGAVELRGDAEDGELLEGFDLAQEGFEDWLRAERLSDRRPAARATALTDAARHSSWPRIAVLPFAELAPEGARGVGRALAYEITAGFARSQLIDAISHFSALDLQAPGAPGAEAQLDADYLLTGQCRLSGDALSVGVTLHDTASRTILRSEDFRTGLKGYLAGDASLVAEVVGDVLQGIMAASVAEIASRPLPELAAHHLMIASVSLMHAFERPHFDRAEAQLREVAARAHRHSEPLAWLAQWHLLRVHQKWSPDPAKDQARARDYVAAALDLNPACPLSLAIDANLHTLFLHDFDAARRRFDAATAINPSSALICHLASVLATFEADGAEAVRLTERAYRLSPRDPRRPFFQTLSAGSYVVGEQYDRAVQMAEASLRHNPQHLSAHRCRVLGLQLGGREREARVAAAELLRLDPGITVAGYVRDHPSAVSGLAAKLGQALREAGIPLN